MSAVPRETPDNQPHTHDIIVMGASAGGVEALTAFVSGLPQNFPGAIFVVLHMPARGLSFLDRILSHAGPLHAHIAQDGEPIIQGRIYVARADCHLLLTPLCARVTHGPRENRSRPAIDPLFRTAAVAFGPRVVGIVFSGMLNDGTAGLLAIKERGGVALAQDPETALFPQMPKSADAYVDLDGMDTPTGLAHKVIELAREVVSAPEGAFPVSDDMAFEANALGLDPSVLDRDERPGTLTAFSCPECQGPIWETRSGQLPRFRCRVGHAFTAETMVEGQAEHVENSMWVAVNTLEESAQLYDHLAVSARPAPGAKGRCVRAAGAVSPSARHDHPPDGHIRRGARRLSAPESAYPNSRVRAARRTVVICSGSSPSSAMRLSWARVAAQEGACAV